MADTFKAYPAKRYHADGRTAYVHTHADDEALGAGWSNSRKAAAPVEVKKPGRRPKPDHGYFTEKPQE